MKFSSALTTQTDAAKAACELCESTREQIGDTRVDLAFMFASPRYIEALPDLIEDLHVRLAARHLVGCTGAGVIGVDQEVEKGSAISLWAASLPNVMVEPFRVTQQQVEESTGPAFWHGELDVDPKLEPSFVLLPDPFTSDAARWIEELGEAYPGRPMIGGLVSGARKAGENRMWINEKIHDDGLVGVALMGPVKLQTVVSQGCRPVGEPLIITKAQRNVVLELANQPPGLVLQKLLNDLPENDRHLAQQALFVGRVINEYQEEFHRGDFLIRNIIGYDQATGAIAVGDRDIRPGQTIQFQLRDGSTAEEDLRELLSKQQAELKLRPPHGALLFSCLGRGESLFGKPNHDIQTLRAKVGPVPVAGFFCNGEIGPVGERVFVHGYTSVIGLFGPA